MLAARSKSTRNVNAKTRAGRPVWRTPAHLADQELACWRELVSIAPLGALTAGDRWVVEMAARLMAEYREVGREFTPGRLQRLHSVMAALRMTPADRSKVVGLTKMQEERQPLLESLMAR